MRTHASSLSAGGTPVPTRSPRHRCTPVGAASRPLVSTATILALACAPAALPTTALAITKVWQAPTATPAAWSDPASWLGGVPTASDLALINNGGIATIASGNAVASSLQLGQATTESGSLTLTGGRLTIGGSAGMVAGAEGAASVDHTGGTLTFSTFVPLYIGFEATSSGSYQLSSAGILSSSREYIGYRGSASFSQTGGTHTIAGTAASLYLGYQVGSTGAYSLSGTGKLAGDFAASQYVGYDGVASFIHSAGTNTLSTNISGSLYLGYNAGSTGTYSLSGASQLVPGFAGKIYVGHGGSGTFDQTGGTVANSGGSTLYLGYNPAATGSYSLSGGTLGPAAVVGYKGSGTFTQTGGTAGSVTLGSSTASAGHFSLSAGSVVGIVAGDAGTGTVLQTGGTVTGGAMVGRSIGGYGSYSLAAGELNGIYVGYGGNGTFTQTGGTVTGAVFAGFSGNGHVNHLAGAVNNNVYVAQNFGATGFYTLGPAASITGGSIDIGGAELATGSFVQNGGSVTLSYGLHIGSAAGSTGYYSLAAGAIVAGRTLLAYNGTTTFSQTGGSHSSSLGTFAIYGGNSSYTLSGGSLSTGDFYLLAKTSFVHSGGTVTIGDGSAEYPLFMESSTSGISTYTLSNDAVLLSGPQYIGHGYYGNPTFSQTGGINDLRGNTLYVQYIPNADFIHYDGTYSLSGTGILRAGPEVIGFGPDNTRAAGTGLFRQSGGTNFASSLTVNPTGRYELVSGALVVSGPLTLAPGSTFDFAGGAAAFRHPDGPSPADSIRSLLFTGRNGGDWLGLGGISSSSGAADLFHLSAVGYAESSDLLASPEGSSTPIWHGISIDAPSLLMVLTVYGDANLDGVLNQDDFALLDKGFLTAGDHWQEGDFNYDGTVDSADYLLADRTLALLNHALTPEYLADRQARFGVGYVDTLLTSVPEPAQLAIPVLFFLLRATRSRRARQT